MKSWIILGAFLAALAVIFGAFGAHGLKNKVSPDDLIIFETGVKYHICLLYTSPSPRDQRGSRMPSSA